MQHLILIGDIIASRRLPDRKATQEKLAATVAHLNRRSVHALSSPYTITLGDEFQAVFHCADTIFHDAVSLLLALHPVQIRFAWGLGSLDTPLNPDMAIGMDGPAFHHARAAMTALKKTPHLFTIAGEPLQHPGLAEASLHLISHSLHKWKKNRLHVFSLLSEGMAVKTIARRLGISEQAVYKTIDAGGLRIILSLFEELALLINESLKEK